MVSLPALRAGSATEDFPRLGAGELADRLASHRGLQQLAQPVVEALSRQVADLQSVVILSDPDGLVLHTRRYPCAAKGPARGAGSRQSVE